MPVLCELEHNFTILNDYKSLLSCFCPYIVGDAYDLLDAKCLMWHTIPNAGNLPKGKWVFAYNYPLWYEIPRNAITK